ncbi:MoaD/ThiS family protein [Chloroflexota bacterium]
MKIVLAGSLDLGSEVLELEDPKTTLRDLLTTVNENRERKLPFIDPQTGKLDELFKISINGKDCQYLPQGLNTTMNDGDMVEIYILAIGGG